MRHFIDYEPNGRLVSAGCEQDGLAQPAVPGAARAYIDWPLDGPLGDWHVSVGMPTRKLPQPSPHHQFDYNDKAWVLDESAAWAAVRADRDRRLSATDWVVLRAADTGQPVPPEWLAYRQALRDITEQPDPLNIEWPVAPAA